MNIQSLDTELLSLTTKYNNLDQKFSVIESEIEDLENEKDDIEIEMSSLEKRIAELESEILLQEISSKISGGNFTNAFIKASCFAQRKEGGNGIFKHVSIGENKLIASDKFRVVILRGINVPEELKNSAIKYDVRENFADNINKEVGKFPDVKEVVRKAREASTITKLLTSKDFYEHFNIEVKPKTYKHDIDIVKLNTGIQFNKFNLYTALLCFGDEQFDFYAKGILDPVLFDNENMSVVIAPLRCDL